MYPTDERNAPPQFSEFIKRATVTLLLEWDTPEQQIVGATSQRIALKKHDDPVVEALADCVDRCGHPRVIAMLAQVVSMVNGMQSHGAVDEGTDAAEAALVEAADAVVSAWEKFDARK